MEECAFSSLSLSCLWDMPHQPLYSAGVPGPGSFLRPVAPGWSAARQGWLWMWGEWELPVMVFKDFLKEKGNQGSWPLSCSVARPFFCSYFSRKDDIKKRGSRCTLWTSVIILPTLLRACSCPLCVTSTLPSAP